MATTAAERDPRHHMRNMQKRLQEIKDHLRADIEKVDEPQLKAMFETSAEVLGGQGVPRLRAEERKRLAVITTTADTTAWKRPWLLDVTSPAVPGRSAPLQSP